MFTCSAIRDFTEDTLIHVTALLHGHRREIGTRAGRRAVEAELPISISYRYLHSAIDVIAEQASDLHEVLERAKREGWSHLTRCLRRIRLCPSRASGGTFDRAANAHGETTKLLLDDLADANGMNFSGVRGATVGRSRYWWLSSFIIRVRLELPCR